MKKRITVLSMAVGLLILSLILIHQQKYSIDEITADNFEEKLTQIRKGNIFSAGVQHLFEVNELATVITMKCIQTQGRFHITQTNNSNGTLTTEIRHPDFNFLYTITWEDQDCKKINPFFFGIMTLPARGLFSSDSDFKEIDMVVKAEIDKLRLERGFLLKKSDYKNGYDILIVEREDTYVIGKISGQYDSGEIAGINFAIYKKSKYF